MQLTVASYKIHKAVGLDRRRDPERIIAVLRADEPPLFRINYWVTACPLDGIVLPWS